MDLFFKNVFLIHIFEFLKKMNCRQGLQVWSSSAEAFYWLRHSFVTSYSTLCVAHWILGVGDRHLNNCLVSRSNGKCIGIDFGHCFGTATQFLPVPELIPFRLTPHILNVVQPYSTSGKRLIFFKNKIKLWEIFL